MNHILCEDLASWYPYASPTELVKVPDPPVCSSPVKPMSLGLSPGLLSYTCCTKALQGATWDEVAQGNWRHADDPLWQSWTLLR